MCVLFTSQPEFPYRLVYWKTSDKNRDYVRFKVVSFRVKLS